MSHQNVLRRYFTKKTVLIVTMSILLILGSGFSGDSFGQEGTDKKVTTKPDGRGAGDILRILNPSAPTILNPHLSVAKKDWESCRITYEPLASFDKDGHLIPFLAAEIPSLENGGVAADGKSVTWKLEHDVKWSDGIPFTADDVLFTYQFVTNPEVKAPTVNFYSTIETVQVIDPYTITIHFKEVTPAWALPFVGSRGLIIPRHIFAPYNGANAREAPANTLPVGTGPYRVMPPGIKPQEVLLLGMQIVETNKIVFEPNPFFREPEKLSFSRIELRGGGTPKRAAKSVLQKGSVDLAYNLGLLSQAELAALEIVKGDLVMAPEARVTRILLNRTDPHRETEDGERSHLNFPHPFFSDKRVRRAFAYAIDKEAISETYGPAGESVDNNLVDPPQYASPNSFYEFNLEKSKTLLDEAGWIDSDGDGIRDKDGEKLKVIFQGYVNTSDQQTQHIVKSSLNSIGIDVELKVTDPSIMFGPASASPDSAWHFNSDMALFSIKSHSPDPSGYMRGWTCAQIPQKANNWQGLNFERWCSPEYDALLQKSDTELDPEKRRQLFIQMNDMLIEDVVMIPIIYLYHGIGVSTSIENIDPTPWDASAWNIQNWRRVAP